MCHNVPSWLLTKNKGIDEGGGGGGGGGGGIDENPPPPQKKKKNNCRFDGLVLRAILGLQPDPLHCFLI